MTTEIIDVSQLSKEMQEYLASLDRQTQKSTQNFIPMLNIVNSVQQSKEVQAPMGKLFLVKKNELGDKEYEVVGDTVEVIILKVMNSYSVTEETSPQKWERIYSTNEFGDGEERCVMRNKEGVEMYRGNPKEFKQWAISRYPGKASTYWPTSVFKFGFIFYVLIPSRMEQHGPAGSVFRLTLSSTCMDSWKQFQKNAQGAPIRYMTRVGTEPNSNGVGRKGTFEALHSIPVSQLADILKIKMELDEAIKGIVDDFCGVSEDTDTPIYPASPEVYAKVEPMGQVIPAGKMPGANWTIVDIPFANSPVTDLDAKSIFGI